jgi:hypothetical protein
MSTPVVAPQADFRAACAELPRSARLVDEPRGAVVVTTGSADSLVRAAEQGAVALIAPRPGSALPDVGLPVVVDRPLLRVDLAADARSDQAPALVQIEASAAVADVPATLRDALGWARILVGGTLELRERQVAPDAVTVLLDGGTRDATPVPVALVITSRRGTSPWLRATALGPERREVVVDVARGLARVERASVDGRTFPPIRWESPARLALRRALDAVTGARPADLTDWNHDDALAQAIAGPPAYVEK